jgi:hypothetical protein
MEDALAAVAKLEKSIEFLGDEVRTLQTQFKKMSEAGSSITTPGGEQPPATIAELPFVILGGSGPVKLESRPVGEQYKELMRSQNESEPTVAQMAETEGYLRFRAHSELATTVEEDREKMIEALTRKLHDARDRQMYSFYASNQAILKLNEIRASIMRDVAYGETDDEKLCATIDRELNTHKASVEGYQRKQAAYMALWD